MSKRCIQSTSSSFAFWPVSGAVCREIEIEIENKNIEKWQKGRKTEEGGTEIERERVY